MRLHVLAGCRSLLQPEVLSPESAASLIGPCVRVATASWISPECGNSYHDFLQDEAGDCRTSTMALALKEGFGTRFEPLLVLPDLIDEMKPDEERVSRDAGTNRRSQLGALSEILACGHVRELQLFGLAIPSKADPDGVWAVPAGIVPGAVRQRIEKLRGAIAAANQSQMIDTHVIEATPDIPIFTTIYNNAACNHITFRLAERLRERGWTSDQQDLGRAVVRILADWNKKGILLTLPLSAGHLEGMTEVIYKGLLRIDT